MRFFDPHFLNGPQGDPALYVELTGQGRSLLFDCGRLHRLSPSKALRLTHLFITHTHIDHFVGFDPLIRLLLGQDRHLRVVGPPGIIANVAGHLAGYTWNLVDGQTLIIEAVEVEGDVIRTKAFHCAEAFSDHRETRTHLPAVPGRVLDDNQIEVRCAALDHYIPSLAFSVREKDRINVLEEGLEADGLERGGWLRELKECVRSGAPPHTEIQTPRGPAFLESLSEKYIQISPGEKIAYVADNLFSETNVSLILDLIQGADVLYCEGGFLSEDEDKATAARHLTAAQAGEIARRAACGRVEIFHFSPKYIDRFDELRRECEEAFGSPGKGEG